AVGTRFQAFQQVLQLVDIRLERQTMARRHGSLLGYRGRSIVMLCGVQDTEEGPGGQLILPPHPKPCYRLSASVWPKVHSRQPSAEKRWNKLGYWLKTHPYTAAGVVALLIAAVAFCRRQQSEWEGVYVPAAAHLWKGEDMYRPEEAYLYPPFMAWTALPFLA